MLESLLRELGAGVAFVDRDLRYVLVNERLARLNGVAAAAHSGRTVREVIPAYADQADRALAQVFGSGRAVGEIPVDVPGAGGEPALRLLITCFPVRDAAGEVRWAGVIASDVTERERATRELRESEERFRLAARAARDVVWDWNLTTDSVAAADGVMRVFGFPEAQVGSGTSWWAEQLHPEDRDRVLASIAAAVEHGEFWSEEYRHRRADGEYATVVDRAYVVRDDGGRAVRMVGVTTDVTQERRVLEQAEAAQRMETVGRLAGGVAHEVNNALQGVLSFTDFVLRSLQSGVVHRSDVEQIRHAAERAARITRQLLAFSRRQLLTPERLDLNAVVTELAPMLRQAIGGARELSLALAAEPVTVAADRGQLEQVLLNLALNARDAMPEGGRLAVRVGHTHLDAAALASVTDAPAAGRYGVIEVTDNGCGMSAAVQARIFEPFFTTKPLGTGTGLGLSVVYGIVRQSGGLVTCDSEPGRGTRFSVHLPVTDPPHTLAPADESP